MSAQRKQRSSMFSWLCCCGGQEDEVDESHTPEKPTKPLSAPEPAATSDRAAMDRALSLKVPSSRPVSSASVAAKRDSLRAVSTALDVDVVFPDEGVVYEVLGLKYDRGTLRSNPFSQGEDHLQKVENSAREARATILGSSATPSTADPSSTIDVAGMDLEPLDITHVQSLLKVSLVLADVLQMQGKIEEADQILGDTLDRLLDTALTESARISDTQSIANPLASLSLSPTISKSSSTSTTKEERALPLRLKAAAHHRMGSIKRSQGDLSSAEAHLRAAADILGQCAAAGDKTANNEKAATLALLATILMRVGKEDEAALVDREALALRADSDAA